MGIIVRPHPYPDGAVARPDHANVNETTLYNLVNGNIDWDNIKAALVNAANGLVKLDASALVPLAQIPVLTADKLPTVIPSGVIVMWSGTLGTIPAGWSLCDGTGETPDLRDKFIYGWSDGVDPGGEGGAATHTHTYSDLPSHSHTSAGAHAHGVGTLVADAVGNHTHNMVWRPKYVSAELGGTYNEVGSLGGTTGAAGGHSHTISGSTASADVHTHPAAGVASPETDAGSTLPPYYKLAFIQKD